MKLTKSELEVMNVLWKAERPLSRADMAFLNGLLRRAGKTTLSISFSTAC